MYIYICMRIYTYEVYFISSLLFNSYIFFSLLLHYMFLQLCEFPQYGINKGIIIVILTYFAMFEETLSVDAVLAGSVDPSGKGH